MIILIQLSFYGFFLQSYLHHCQKPFFHKNVRFQAVTKVFHKFVVLDNFSRNYNVDLIIF